LDGFPWIKQSQKSASSQASLQFLRCLSRTHGSVRRYHRHGRPALLRRQDRLPLTEFAKTGLFPSLSPVESQTSTPQSTPTLRSSLSSIRLTPPMIQRSKVYFFINTLLLTVPLKKLDSGIVLLTLPMNLVGESLSLLLLVHPSPPPFLP
jgi:hypothetical protein